MGAGRQKAPWTRGICLSLCWQEVNCTVGATTLDEYRKHIERTPLWKGDSTCFNKRAHRGRHNFHIEGLKERYEIFHGVQIQDQALIAAATSHRYITDRFLPDKAIDLVDEARAMIRTEIDSYPSEMDEISRKIMQLEIEEMALNKETDSLSKERLNKIRSSCRIQESFQQMKARWEKEKQDINKVQDIKKQLDKINAEIEIAQRNLITKNRQASLRKLPLQKQLEEAQQQSGKEQSSLLRDKVTEEEIAKIVSRWTGIPVTKLMEGEREKILKLDAVLHKRVVGQNEAVTKVAEAIIRSRAGIADPNRPIGSFMFLGPHGQNRIAKALAEALFDDEHNLTRIDMSEYMERFFHFKAYRRSSRICGL